MTASTYSTSPSSGAGTPQQASGGYPSSGTQYLAGAGSATTAVGHTLLTYYSGRVQIGVTLPLSAETVDWALSEGGTGANGTCTIDAQVIYSG
jgi:hypothetical protein